MILRSSIRPADDAGGEVRTLEVVAASFEQGVAELEAQTPEGWRRLHVIVDR